MPAYYKKFSFRLNPYQIIIFLLIFVSCKKDVVSTKEQIQNYNGSLKFEFVPQSIEKIFVSQTTWEARTLSYYNIINQGSNWSMFYGSYGRNQYDCDGSFCFAQSLNGMLWNRASLNNNKNIIIDGKDDDGITGNFVFIDSSDVQYHYKMVCLKLVNGVQKTFLYESHDGLSWIVMKKLFDTKQDSQFSMINLNGEYYLFSRYNDNTNGYQRAISLAILDKNLNVIKQPSLLLEAEADSYYPHIYNSAASKINDSTVLLLPTFFNEITSEIRIKSIYTNNLKDYYLIDDNITDKLFPDGNVNFAIVSPGVVPTGEKNTYWIYYWGTDAKHNSFPFSNKINVTYYRIKLVIH